MRSIEEAILRTVLYADVFNFPMTEQEIHHFLIHDKVVSLEQIQQVIEQSNWLNEMLERIDRYIVFIGRSDIISTREEREQASQHLWPLAVNYGQWLSCLPFVRMVALTGALAMRNAASGDDDLDFIVVTAPRRVWIARAFSIVLVRLARLRGAKVCPNYVLSEAALPQEHTNIFMAHEVAQMVPIYGHTLYERFRHANAWVATQLPNASNAFYSEKESSPGLFWKASKGLFEITLRGGIGDWIENWELRRKLKRFAPEIKKIHSSAKLDDTQVKGHFDDHGHPTLQKYYSRLQEYGLEQQPAELIGK